MRVWRIFLAMLSSGSLFALQPSAAIEVANEQRPNFLLIVLDDMGYSDPGSGIRFHS